MRAVITMILVAACLAAPAAADQCVVGKRGTNSDYPFRGC